MPRLKYMEVPKASLHGIPIQAGQIIHCLDSEELFYDNSNTIRIQSTNIIPIDSLSSVPSPEHNKLYIDRHKYIDDYGREVYQGPEYATLYKYNDKAYWQQVNETSEVNSFLSSYTELVPSILSEDGQNRAPATMASVVFTDSGDNLEDLVKEIKVLKVNQEEIEVEYNNQTDFLTHPPYDGYFKYPNRIKSKIINNEKKTEKNNNEIKVRKNSFDFDIEMDDEFIASETRKEMSNSPSSISKSRKDSPRSPTNRDNRHTTRKESVPG